MKTYICKTCGAPKERQLTGQKRLVCKPCAYAKCKVWREANKDILAAKKKAYHDAFPDVRKNRCLVKSYGLTLTQYQEMLREQNGVCAVCRLPETARSKRYKNLCVDHDHATGKIRALLCNKCNRALGLLHDDFEVLMRLTKYIHEHKSIT